MGSDFCSDSSEYLLFLEWVREGIPTGDSAVPLGDFNTHMGNDSMNWRGVMESNGPPCLNPTRVHLLYFCESHIFPLTITVFEQKDVQKCTWHQDIFGHRSVNTFIIVSADLWLYVQYTQLKRGAELSPDHPGGELDQVEGENARQTRQT